MQFPELAWGMLEMLPEQMVEMAKIEKIPFFGDGFKWQVGIIFPHRLVAVAPTGRTEYSGSRPARFLIPF